MSYETTYQDWAEGNIEKLFNPLALAKRKKELPIQNQTADRDMHKSIYGFYPRGVPQ
ncbi:MAG: hypothetical protein AB8G22_02965 [Saprospiraceae bacterium]